MPKIFTKDCKFNVIEYGSYTPGLEWKSFWMQVRKFLKI